jgi:hypothetical protein
MGHALAVFLKINMVEPISQEVVKTLQVYILILFYNVGQPVSKSLIQHLGPDLLHKLQFNIILLHQLSESLLYVVC